MKCACCSSNVLTSLAAVVGIVGLGIGGYNMINTGCPLGGCGDSAAAPSSCCSEELTATATPTDCSGCPLMTEQAKKDEADKKAKELAGNVEKPTETVATTPERQPG